MIGSVILFSLQPDYDLFEKKKILNATDYLNYWNDSDSGTIYNKKMIKMRSGSSWVLSGCQTCNVKHVMNFFIYLSSRSPLWTWKEQTDLIHSKSPVLPPFVIAKPAVRSCVYSKEKAQPNFCASTYLYLTVIQWRYNVIICSNTFGSTVYNYKMVNALFSELSNRFNPTKCQPRYKTMLCVRWTAL